MDGGVGEIFDDVFSVEGSVCSFVNTGRQAHQVCELHKIQLKSQKHLNEHLFT